MELRSGLTDLYSGDTDSLKNSLIGSIKGSTEKESNLLGYLGGTGVEVGAGYGVDLATTGMLAGGPIGWLSYAGINFTSGAAANIAAQKLRGEEEIGWGEVLSSGLIDIIPFFGQKLKGAKGITNIGVQAAARTAAQRQGEVAFDDQRWLTPRETLEAAALGGAFGLGFKGAGEGISFLRGKYGKYGKNEAKKKFPTEVVEELDKQDRLVDDDAIDDMNRLRSGLKMRLRRSIDPESVEPVVPPSNDTIRRWPDGSVAQNPYLRIYKREDAARIGQGLQDAVPPKPSAAVKWEKRMDEIYKLLTGRDPDLPTVGVEKLQGIPLGGREPGPKFIKHHPYPLAHIARSLDYLTDEGVVEGSEYLSKRFGSKLGDFQKGTLAPDKFHSKLHRLLDEGLGSSKKGLLYKLEEKYFGKRKLSDGISLEERIKSGFFDELVDIIIQQKEFIDDFYRALANRAEFKKVSIEEYVNEAAETVKADRILKAIEAGKTTKGKGIQDLVDELIGLENKPLRDASMDINQLMKSDAINTSLAVPAKRKLLEGLLVEFLNMDWAGGKLDAGKQVLKLIDKYNLEDFMEIDWQTKLIKEMEDLVDELETKDITKVLAKEHAKEVIEWTGD